MAFTPDPLETTGPQSTDGCPIRCAPDYPCASVFDRVRISRMVAGGTVISWSLVPEFTDPGPLTFTVTVSSDYMSDPGDWKIVGTVTDTYQIVDPDQEEVYIDRRAGYQVTVASSLGTYVSDIVRSDGMLNDREWGIALTALRQFSADQRYNADNVRGFLMKRRWSTATCSRCFIGGRVTDSNCPECYGTGYRCGFYAPMTCQYLKVTRRPKDFVYDPQRGNTSTLDVMQAEFSPADMVDEQDLFIADRSDDRWLIKGVIPKLEIRQFPVVATVHVWQAPPTSILYTVPRPVTT